MKDDKLTTLQQRFVDYYDGNATEAARKAGYKGNDHTLQVIGSQNLLKLVIAEAIRKREEKKTRKGILTREQRQQMWSAFAASKDLIPRKKEVVCPHCNGPFHIDLFEMPIETKDRLHALDSLGKSEGDFITKIVGDKDNPLEMQIRPAPRQLTSSEAKQARIEFGDNY